MHVLVSAINRMDDLLDTEDQLERQEIIPLDTTLDLGGRNRPKATTTTTEGVKPMEIDEPLRTESRTIEPMTVCNSSSENSSTGSTLPVSTVSISENGQASNPGSPLEQVAQEEGGHPITSIGTVNSVPCSPHINPNLEKSEKYDDLSESDNESGENN
jgi:hypothetical protein